MFPAVFHHLQGSLLVGQCLHLHHRPTTLPTHTNGVCTPMIYSMVFPLVFTSMDRADTPPWFSRCRGGPPWPPFIFNDWSRRLWSWYQLFQLKRAHKEN